MGLAREHSQSVKRQVVLLDAVGTVLGLRRSVADCYHEIAGRAGLALTRSAIQHRFPGAFQRVFCPWQTALPTTWLAYEAAWRAGDATKLPPIADVISRARFAEFFQLPVDEVREKKQWQLLVADVLAVPVDQAAQAKTDEAFAALWAMFARPETWVVSVETTQFLARLRSKGLHVCLASNFDQRLEVITQGLSSALPVDRVFFSSQVGYRKPDPRFYQQILEQLNVSPDETVMIGDRWWEDYAAPTQCGISSYFYAPTAEPSEPLSGGQEHGNPRILTRLADLPL